MTTPDTLAELIAEMKAEVQGNTMPILSDSATLHWAVRLEAALDALAERWEAEAKQYRAWCEQQPYDPRAVKEWPLGSVYYEACAAELRGAGEPKAAEGQKI